MPKHSDEVNLTVIAARYVRVVKKNGGPRSLGTLDVLGALRAYHENVRALDLDRMAVWDRDLDIVHDVAGILRCNNPAERIHRDTFTPRFAARL